LVSDKIRHFFLFLFPTLIALISAEWIAYSGYLFMIKNEAVIKAAWGRAFEMYYFQVAMVIGGLVSLLIAALIRTRPRISNLNHP